MQKRLRVGIIGGGLGGLAAAIATARTGADVTVLEAATELGEIGAGIHVRDLLKRPNSNLELITQPDLPKCFTLLTQMGCR